MSKMVPSPTVLPNSAEEVLSLVKRAEKGDRRTLPALRELMKFPEAVGVFGGDLAREAQATLIAKLCGTDLLAQEALLGKLELLRADLVGLKPTSLERLLVERVVGCWLHLHHLEWMYAKDESMHLELGNYYQRCLDRAQRRFLSAIKTLAMVRKMAVPVLQLNFRQNQVNVAGGSIAEETVADC